MISWKPFKSKILNGQFILHLLPRDIEAIEKWKDICLSSMESYPHDLYELINNEQFINLLYSEDNKDAPLICFELIDQAYYMLCTFLILLSPSNHSCQFLYSCSNSTIPYSRFLIGKIFKECTVNIHAYLKETDIRNVLAFLLDGTNSLQRQLSKNNFTKIGCLKKYLLCVNKDSEIVGNNEIDSLVYYKIL